ncbi:MAG: hypothetical protein ACYC7D_05210 [Nitrososphaerales archaeon]
MKVPKHVIVATPAQKAGLQITDGWSELIDKATQHEAKNREKRIGSEQTPAQEIAAVVN